MENDVSDWYTVACVIDEREFARRYARAGDVALSEKSRKKPPLKGKVFLVFVTGEYRVFQWRWEDADRIGKDTR